MIKVIKSKSQSKSKSKSKLLRKKTAYIEIIKESKFHSWVAVEL